MSNIESEVIFLLQPMTSSIDEHIEDQTHTIEHSFQSIYMRSLVAMGQVQQPIKREIRSDPNPARHKFT